MKRIAVQFVCMGNICRSPMAEIVALSQAKKFGFKNKCEFASAGTHHYHVGDAPDARSIACALQRGYDMSALRAKHFRAHDFSYFDLILAMDNENLSNLKRLCPNAHKNKLDLILHFGARKEIEEVPDPYYGGADGFNLVLDLIEDAVQGLLKHLQQEYFLEKNLATVKPASANYSQKKK